MKHRSEISLLLAAVFFTAIYVTYVNEEVSNKHGYQRKFMNTQDAEFPTQYQIGNLVLQDKNVTYVKEKLAVLIPFRDVFEELLIFAPYITRFLEFKKIPHHLFVLNQAGPYRFNKGALMNVGFLYTKDKYDYLVIHDIDFLPLNKDLSYDSPGSGVYNILAPWFHPDKRYAALRHNLGGIVMVTHKDYEFLNGMSNHFWGWGKEDDEFRERIKKMKVEIKRPENIKTGRKGTFKVIHAPHRKRDKKQCFHQKSQLIQKRTQWDGANATKYNIASITDLEIEGILLTVLNVEVQCDKKITPWCDC